MGEYRYLFTFLLTLKFSHLVLDQKKNSKREKDANESNKDIAGVLEQHS